MKKLLFVSARLPYPTTEGHQIRTFGILQELSKQYEIHLLSILREGEVINVENKLGRICKSINGVECIKNKLDYVSPIIKAVINGLPFVVTKYVTKSLIKEYIKLLETIKPDIVHLDLLPLSYLINYTPYNIPTVLNEHNVESSLIKQKLSTINNLFIKLIYYREYHYLHIFEYNMTQKARLTLVCSENDRKSLIKHANDNIIVIPNGIDTQYLKPTELVVNQQNKLVFIGGMNWYPNKIGMTWFINSVFPLIIKLVPDVSLDIIGNPDPKIDIPEYLLPYVTIHGFVDDFRDYINRSKVMIVPLTLGSGTRLKVLEGMAMKKCIVSTTIGAEGIDVMHTKNILLANDEDDFCNAVVSCLNSDMLRNNIEENAVKLAEKKYDWSVIGKSILSEYNHLSN